MLHHAALKFGRFLETISLYINIRIFLQRASKHNLSVMSPYCLRNRPKNKGIVPVFRGLKFHPSYCDLGINVMLSCLSGIILAKPFQPIYLFLVHRGEGGGSLSSSSLTILRDLLHILPTQQTRVATSAPEQCRQIDMKQQRGQSRLVGEKCNRRH